MIIMKTNDLISRQAAIAEFKHYALYDSNRTNAEWVKRIELVLESLPSAEKHGKWVKISDRNYKCSCCNAWWSVDGDSTMKDFKYCPNCGARMDGDE